ncbi:MAG: pseudouridine synthase [Chloroflexota bacterium]|nr:pseudouridine synthase [Chloroflexota bacterium]
MLTESGAGSRRKMADAIREGRVSVNGIKAQSFRQEVYLANDSVTLDGVVIDLAGAKPSIYLVMNKPLGVITTTNDEKGRLSVLDIIPDKYDGVRLFPVGRLDRDSTGLLLLTNDGDLTYRLTHPKFEHEKEYMIAIDGLISQRDKQRLQSGVWLADGKTYLARVKRVNNRFPFNYSITIHEGRNRQVRRMFEELGYQVSALKRIRIGKLHLSNLKEGEVRELSGRKIKGLFAAD